MPTLIDRHGRVADRWIRVDSGADRRIRADGAAPGVPTGASVLLSLPAWRAEASAWRGRAARIGVVLAPADEPGELAGDLGSLALVAVEFPVFTDGRGYSIARLLRQRYGWRGELRAVGDVQRDQLLALSRCGFDSFALADGIDADAALAALREFDEHYQADANRGPLFERRLDHRLDRGLDGRSDRDGCRPAQAVREFPIAGTRRTHPLFEENNA